MGNSEVGHLNMGAGRIVYQELTRITKEIQDGDFFKNEALLHAVEELQKRTEALFICSVFFLTAAYTATSLICLAFLSWQREEGLEKVYVHCFLDGRDTPPQSGKGYVQELTDKLAELGVGKIATVMGRYYAMDRDNRWDRVERAYNAITKGLGVSAESGVAAVQNSYNNGKNDEFVEPAVVMENGKPVATVQDGDSVIFFNFRPDRAREITRAFC